MQHRVWSVMLWREEELVLACHVVQCRVLACHLVLCRQRELLLGLLVVLCRWKELGFLLCQQVTVLLQGLSKEAEFRGCCHLEVKCGRQHSDVGLSETIEKCFFQSITSGLGKRLEKSSLHLARCLARGLHKKVVLHTFCFITKSIFLHLPGVSYEIYHFKCFSLHCKF